MDGHNARPKQWYFVIACWLATAEYTRCDKQKGGGVRETKIDLETKEAAVANWTRLVYKGTNKAGLFAKAITFDDALVSANKYVYHERINCVGGRVLTFQILQIT